MARDDGFLMFLAGVGVGVAGAMLLAPTTGEQLRARLRDKAVEAGDYLSDRANTLREPVEQAITKGKRAVGDTLSKGKESLDDFQSTLKGKANEAADAAKKVANQAADRSRDFAHEAGKSIEQGGKRVQDV